MPDEPRLPVSAAEVINEIAEAIERAGLHPAHAFAVRQFGFLLTEMNMATSPTTRSTSGKTLSTAGSRCTPTTRASADR